MAWGIDGEGTFDDGMITDWDDIDQYIGGKLWGVGHNALGQLGDNTVNNKSSPVQTITGGANWCKLPPNRTNHIAAIKTDGTLWVWGENNAGQLGDNTIVKKSSPIQTVAGGANWKCAACAAEHTLAVKTDGTLWGWGDNTAGQLGDNTIVKKSSPVQTIAGGTNWKQVTGRYQLAAAVKTDGTLWTWGVGQQGCLGDGTVLSKSSPVQTIAGGTNWKYVAGGSYGFVALKTDGTLWGWGANEYGQLGTNDVVDRSSPVQTIAGGTNWKQVSACYRVTGAIKTDGTLWVWGLNNNAMLGDGTLINRSSPVQTVAGGNNWKMVRVEDANSAAIKTDGTLWTWGINTYGQLGDNTITPKSSPVQTIAGGTNWKAVCAGGNAIMALTFTDEK